MSSSGTTRRRFFQFRLRTLLALIALIAVGLFAFRLYIEPFRRQRETMGLIERLGGTYQTSAATSWQRQMFGGDFQNITRVDLADCDDPAAYLERVADLPMLRVLVVGGPAFGDEHLRQLHSLGTLQNLVLDSAAVSDKAIQELRQRIPGAFIYLSERRSVLWLAPRYPTRTSSDFPPQVRQLIDPKFSSVADRVDLFLGPHFTEDKLAHIVPLRHLTSLGLSSTGISDDGLARLSTLRRLKELDLSRTLITDAALQQLNVYGQLQKLYLAGTSVGDAGLAALSSLSQLAHLDLSETGVTDNGLVHLRGLTRLKRLDLDGTAISDSGLAPLAALPQLRELHLSQTEVTDAGIIHLRQLANLRYLDLFGTRVSQTGVERLRELLPSCNSIAYGLRKD
jgi:hypothetical protein